jgi:prevent-host-death family protein
MTNYMTMYMVNIAEAKAQLSDLLDRIAKGESVLICKRNQPIAELRPVAAARTTPRTLGHAKTLVEIPASFFEPLPDDEIDGFEGGFVYPPSRSHASKVAETRGTRGGAKRR